MISVLMADDQDLVRLGLRALFENEAGFTVAGEAADGPAAVEEACRTKPDIVLMDIQLPGVDGLTLTRHIKADPATRHVVVLAFTAYAMKGDEARMLSAGCDGYLSKPIEVSTFAAEVRRWLPRA